MKLLRRTILIIFILLIGSAHAYAGSWFSEIIVFGDSNVDSGAESEYSLFNLTGGAIPGPPNVGDRRCNGPVVVEYAADLLDTKLVNFGVGGARTSATNLVYDFVKIWPEVQFSGVLSQLEWFAETLGKKRRLIRKRFISTGLAPMIFFSRRCLIYRRKSTKRWEISKQR
jgi:hypothetical protein